MDFKELARKAFPFSFKSNDLVGLIVAIIIYAVAATVGGLLLGVLGKIPFIGFIFGFVGWLFGIYCVVGIVIAVLVFLKKVF